MKKPPDNEVPTVSGPGSPEKARSQEVLPKIKGFKIIKKIGEGG
ncbi:unnamed protein product, partial [marine sediment metagenome]